MILNNIMVVIGKNIFRFGLLMTVRHERKQNIVLFSDAAQKMRVGPSEPAYRGRFQTTLSCIGKEPLW